MIRILLIGFSYILPLCLGYLIGFIHGYQSCDTDEFEKRWFDCE